MPTYVVGRWVMFREIVGKVDIVFQPLDFVLALADTIFDPVKSHIHMSRSRLVANWKPSSFSNISCIFGIGNGLASLAISCRSAF